MTKYIDEEGNAVLSPTPKDVFRKCDDCKLFGPTMNDCTICRDKNDGRGFHIPILNKIEIIKDEEDISKNGVNMMVNITRPTNEPPKKSFSSKLEELLNDIRRMLEDKRHDYGNSYEIIRQKFGEVVPLIRLGDKYSRLEKLILETHCVIMNESIEDTYKDIIGYCVLELLYRKGE